MVMTVDRTGKCENEEYYNNRLWPTVVYYVSEHGSLKFSESDWPVTVVYHSIDHAAGNNVLKAIDSFKHLEVCAWCAPWYKN